MKRYEMTIFEIQHYLKNRNNKFLQEDWIHRKYKKMKRIWSLTFS